jgi:hypothetical protein
MEVSLALLTLLGSCCMGLVLLVVFIVVVVLVLSGKLKSAKVTGLGAGVELEAPEPPKPETPTDTPPPPSPAEERPHIDKQQAGIIIGEKATVRDSLFERVAGGDIHEAQEGE